MIKLALTGSIGMGKSTTASLFAERGVRVWDADKAVHRLYAPGGAATGPLLKAFPKIADMHGGIDRAKLSAHLLSTPKDFELVEGIVHPLVFGDRLGFLALAEAQAIPLILLDIPLLFEGEKETTAEVFDKVIVVTAAEDIRRERVLARPGMTEEKYQAILKRQLPEEARLKRADYVIWTDKGLVHATQDVEKILQELTTSSIKSG